MRLQNGVPVHDVPEAALTDARNGVLMTATVVKRKKPDFCGIFGGTPASPPSDKEILAPFLILPVLQRRAPAENQ